MHIFLVNDDGIGSKGIMALYRAAVKRGHEVSMCAPRSQQSAASHRMTLTEPIEVTEYPLEGEGCEGYAIAGSPADCVRVALSQLVKRPVDVLISGINDGHNAGIATHYSGTVGAAMEGAFNHIPSIAVSIIEKATPDMLDHLADYTIRMAEQYAKHQPLRCTILNINAPCVPPEELKEAVYVPLDTGSFIDRYIRNPEDAGTSYVLAHDGSIEPSAAGSDMDYLSRGHITLTLVGNYVSASQAQWDELGIR